MAQRPVVSVCGPGPLHAGISRCVCNQFTIVGTRSGVNSAGSVAISLGLPVCASEQVVGIRQHGDLHVIVPGVLERILQRWRILLRIH